MLLWLIRDPEVLDHLDAVSDEFWVNPDTGEKLQTCPWLHDLQGQGIYTCSIHDIRPEVCRDYPIDIDQMISLDCEMLEEGDLDKPHTQLLIELNELRNASTRS